MNLSTQSKLTMALDYASGTASRNGATLDMAGYESVLGIVTFATIASSAVGDAHWEQGDESNLSDAADLAGTAIVTADDDDNQRFLMDLVKPTKRYVRLVVTKDASNACAESANYLQYGAADLPIDNTDAGEVETELHVSPAEGTK